MEKPNPCTERMVTVLLHTKGVKWGVATICIYMYIEIDNKWVFCVLITVFLPSLQLIDHGIGCDLL